MSIASEITRINTNIAAAYTALDGKGATLPETQNSANLADTIDTITTGGGSGSVDYSSYNSMANNSISEIYGKTFAQIQADSSTTGWYVPKKKRSDSSTPCAGSDGGVRIYKFNDMITPLQFKLNDSKAYKFSSGVTISDTTDETNGIITVTFPTEGERYILVSEEYPYYIKGTTLLGSIVVSSEGSGTLSSIYVDYMCIEYMYSAMNTELYTQSSPKTINWSSAYVDQSITQGSSNNLKAFGISSNIKYNITSFLGDDYVNLGYFAFPKDMSLSDFFDNHIADATYQAKVLNTTQSQQVLSNLMKWAHRDDFPFIIDISGTTNTTTLNLTVTNAWSGSWDETRRMPAAAFTKVKIKLAATKNVKFSENYDRFFPAEYFHYMAENAPSVSGKSISMGPWNRWYRLNCPNDITTLTSKGWTIQ